jgi:hypothetical protein
MAKRSDGSGIEIEGIQPEEMTRVPDAPKPSVARFWSTKERHQIARTGKPNVVFKKYVLLADSTLADFLRRAKVQDVREVVDEPFADESQLAKFNKFLNDLVYSGERGVATRRGLMMLTALFSNEEYSGLEQEQYSKTKGPLTPDVIIMKALKSKSFKGGL